MGIFGKSDMGYLVLKYYEIFGMKVKVDPELKKEWELRYDN